VLSGQGCPVKPTTEPPSALFGTLSSPPLAAVHFNHQAEALWAIAAALERLADVIVGALNPPEASGRHAAGRDKRS
jgi:hypothetical protein